MTHSQIAEWAEAHKEEILAAVEADDYTGFCCHCGAEAYGVEPDGRGYVCSCCGEPAVYGAEELLLYLPFE